MALMSAAAVGLAVAPSLATPVVKMRCEINVDYARMLTPQYDKARGLWVVDVQARPRYGLHVGREVTVGRHV